MTHAMVKGAVHFRGQRRETFGLQHIRPACGDFILTFADDLHDQRLLFLGALLRHPCVPLASLGAPAHKEVTSLFFLARPAPLWHSEGKCSKSGVSGGA